MISRKKLYNQLLSPQRNKSDRVGIYDKTDRAKNSEPVAGPAYNQSSLYGNVSSVSFQPCLYDTARVGRIRSVSYGYRTRRAQLELDQGPIPTAPEISQN